MCHAWCAACRGPAYTVHLEIGYKSKIEAGRTILCTTEVESLEGRKLWMKVRRWVQLSAALAALAALSAPSVVCVLDSSIHQLHGGC